MLLIDFIRGLFETFVLLKDTWLLFVARHRLVADYHRLGHHAFVSGDAKASSIIAKTVRVVVRLVVGWSLCILLTFMQVLFV